MRCVPFAILTPHHRRHFSTVEPVVSLLLSALLLGQALTELRVLGGVLILSAVILLLSGALRVSEQVS